MKKPDRDTLTQTSRVALGVAILVAVMLIVYAILGRLSTGVILGGVYSGALGVINFFVIGLIVQSVADRMAEKQRTEQEIADLSLLMQRRVRASYNLRMIGLFALLVLGIAVFHFDALATILPSVFPSIVIRILQYAQSRKASAAEGSEDLEP